MLELVWIDWEEGIFYLLDGLERVCLSRHPEFLDLPIDYYNADHLVFRIADAYVGDLQMTGDAMKLLLRDRVLDLGGTERGPSLP